MSTVVEKATAGSTTELEIPQLS